MTNTTPQPPSQAPTHATMNQFRIQSDELGIGGAPLTRLAERVGQTPFYAYDRALLRAVCDEFWMVSRGGVEPFDGDLDDYQRYLLDEARRAREEASSQQKRAA